MKKIGLFFVFLLSTSLAYAGDIQVYSDWQGMNLKGAVKTLTQGRSTTDNIAQVSWRKTYYFNASGYLTKIDSSSSFDYADNNQLVSVTTREPWSGALQTAEVTQENTTDGVLRTYHYPKTTGYQQFNHKGLLIENYEIHKGFKEPLHVFTYDANDKRISYTEKNGHGDISEQYQNTYNEQGLVSEQTAHIRYPSHSDTTISFQYECDAQGNWVVQRAYKDNALHATLFRKLTYY